MPWTWEDAEKYKKGLSEKQAKQWARIANSVLERCLKKGGKEEDCAASAVKQANGVVGNNAFVPPESGDAPKEVKEILDKIYTSCREKWVQDHPSDKENTANKTKCSQIAWGAVHRAGWQKDNDGKWTKSGNYSAVINKQTIEYEPEVKLHDNRPYLVVPVTMLVEGVHNGSHGPLLHLKEDFGAYIETWNGIPVVIDHPEINGINVSANIPEIIDQQTVGRVYNSHVEDSKLRAELWLDEQKLNDISPETLTIINEGKMVEVSIGVFTEDEETTGKWGDEYYESIARNHRPDHLALLPGAVGACSIEDGCGIRLNSSSEDTLENPINLKIEKEVKMTELNECTPCVKSRVDKLITQGRFTEAHRGALENLSEELLDIISNPVIQEVEKEVVKEVPQALSEDDQHDLEFGRQMRTEIRNAKIKDIQDNFGKELWPDERLNAMNDDDLDRLQKSIKKTEVRDYSGKAGSVNTLKDESPKLFPTGVEIKN
jgi:cation transport regulator ChaB